MTAPQHPGPPGPRSQALPRSARLHATREFQRVYDEGRKAVGTTMVLWSAPAPAPAIRLGVVASRRVGPSVVRSRCKRRLREAFRRLRTGFRPGQDVVLIARAGLADAPWELVLADVLRLARRTGALPDE